MKLKKIKKDIIESIKSSTSKVRNEEFDFKVQAFANPSFVGAIENSRKNRELAQKRMKEKNDEQKEFIKATVERKANATPKTDAMKKMKMIEKFIKESFKDKLTINENIFTVTTKSRAELKKLIENARKHEVKYTIERINEGYKFNYKFEKLTEDIDDGHFWALVFMEKGDNVEQVEIYEDFDDARADFKYMVQENPKDYEYVVFQEVTIEDGVEDITIIDELRDGELVESKILKEEYSLQRSPYKDIIGRHFNYSVDFEFLDIIALILDRIDFEGDLEDEIDVAINDSLIYIEDQWTVAKFYAPSPADLDWNEVLNDLSNDIHELAEKISDKKDLGESKTVRVKKNIKKSFRR